MDFTHIGLQTKLKLEEVEHALKKIGINNIMEFNKEKDGIYLLSMNPLEGSSCDSDDSEPETTRTPLSEYSKYELKMELLERDK